ncbi:hypothetical protein SAMN05880590_104340 [Rhizobium sp. RU35A]|uniref:hypothetical protein n=1 Tax=Rhizobium sp. RU35A TaxID=1907414 RepID=UPI000953A147|nr:hypothetical protein [Rhizobium sp. RU35A]SIQ49444.1 hypothetical protein SAMN05880590_104340 [Rhizobium sp. RU35A]
MVALSRKSLARMLHLRFLAPTVAVALGTFLFSSGLAETKASADQSLLQIEAVGPRLASMPSLVGSVARAAAKDGVPHIPDVQPALQAAAASAFNPEAMNHDISAALAKTAGTDVETSALAKAAQALIKARTSTVAQTDEASGTPSTPRQTEGYDPQGGERVGQLVEAMASPELAAETAFTEQVMYAALEILTNSTTQQLAALPLPDLQAQTRTTLETLRARNTNEKPVAKDVAQAQEKNRLAAALATLAPEDLGTLSAFYASEDGKAKRDALVAAYRKAADEANIKLLNAYLQQLVTQSKAKAEPQRN